MGNGKEKKKNTDRQNLNDLRQNYVNSSLRHVRKLLSLFVDTPPDASYAQALHCFLKAETVQPRFYCRNAVMLGRCYLRIGHERQGLQWLHAVSVEHGCFSFKLLIRLVLSKFMMKMTKTQSILHA